MRAAAEEQKKKNLPAAVRTLLLVLLFCLFSARGTAAAEEGIFLELGYGYRNTAQSGEQLPVAVTVRNETGEELSGFLSLELPGENGTLSYTSNVTVPAGAETFRRTVTVPAEQAETEVLLRARFSDDSGDVLASGEILMSLPVSGSCVLGGILSDKPQELSWFSGVTLPEGCELRTVNLKPEDFPEDEEGLSQLDLIIMTSFDLTELSSEAVSAVMDWTASGGTLLIGTGSDRSAADVFGPFLGGLTFSVPQVKEADMGMQYSETGPDGAVTVLTVREIGWDGAEILQESGDTGLLLRKAYGSGAVCMAAFDLCELSAFGAAHPGYAEDLAEQVFGLSGLARISRRLTGTEEKLQEADELSNTYAESRIPGISFYAAAAALFVVLSGSVLFRLLRARELGTYYMLGVLILSGTFTLLFWFVSAGTRITKPLLDCGLLAVYDADAGCREAVTGWISMQSPDRDAVTLELSEDTAVLPVRIRGNVSVTGGKTRMLALTGQKPFENSLFRLEAGAAEEDACPVELKVISGQNGPEGIVINRSGHDLTDASLLWSGSMISLGTLKEGESRTFTAEEALSGPVSMKELAADFLCRSPETEGFARQRRSLMLQRLGETAEIRDGKLLFLAFEKDGAPEFLNRTSCTVEGSLLISVSAVLPEAEDGEAWRRISTEPRLISGSWNSADNTVSGTASVVLEYSLGSGHPLNGMRLVTLSPELDGTLVTAFTGQMAFYNYNTSAYDLMNAEKTEWTEEELKPYLSPSGTLTVRWDPDGKAGGKLPAWLPVPFVRYSGAEAAAETMTEENTPAPF